MGGGRGAEPEPEVPSEGAWIRQEREGERRERWMVHHRPHRRHKCKRIRPNPPVPKQQDETGRGGAMVRRLTVLFNAAAIRLSSVRSMSMSTPTECTYHCSDGVKLAALRWGCPSSKRRMLCLHGWMDNAASFSRLVPSLLDSHADTEIVALDFPGHGLSGHKSVDGPPQLLAEFAYYCCELIEAMEWAKKRGNGGDAGMRTVVGNVQRSTTGEDKLPAVASAHDDGDADEDKIILVGHSMGSGVAIVLAAAFPEYFSSLILLEGGLVARNSQDAARHVRAACQRRLKSNRTLFPSIDKSGEDVPRSKVYRTLDSAVEARMSTAQRMPGDQYLSYDAAKDMVKRATVPAQKTSEGRDSESVVFRHDPRLQWPSLQYYTR